MFQVMDNPNTRMSEQKSYKSPAKKLLKFFEKSRDNWKEKYQENKKENKQLKDKIRILKASKQKWKDEAMTLRRQLKQSPVVTESNPSDANKKNRK
jgi:hypothetical protein